MSIGAEADPVYLYNLSESMLSLSLQLPSFIHRASSPFGSHHIIRLGDRGMYLVSTYLMHGCNWQRSGWDLSHWPVLMPRHTVILYHQLILYFTGAHRNGSIDVVTASRLWIIADGWEAPQDNLAMFPMPCYGTNALPATNQQFENWNRNWIFIFIVRQVSNSSMSSILPFTRKCEN